jgi:hypothetical protein
VSEHAVPGTEGPRGHEAGVPVDDRKVPLRVFLFIGAFLAGLGILYWATAYEESGTVMLLVAAVLGLWVAVYLWLQQRGPVGPAIEAQQAAGEAIAAEGAGPVGTGAPEGLTHYLPHASAWPFAIGLGAATLANGLVLGLWVIVPGAALLALGIGGFVRQSRRRD